MKTIYACEKCCHMLHAETDTCPLCGGKAQQVYPTAIMTAKEREERSLRTAISGGIKRLNKRPRPIDPDKYLKYDN